MRTLTRPPLSLAELAGRRRAAELAGQTDEAKRLMLEIDAHLDRLLDDGRTASR